MAIDIGAHELVSALQSLTWTTQPTTGVTGTTMSVSVTKGITGGSTVSFQVRNNSGTSVGSAITGTATGAVWSATITRPATGTAYTILATATDSTSAASASFDATSAPSATLSWTTQPTGGVAGTTTNVSVTKSSSNATQVTLQVTDGNGQPYGAFVNATQSGSVWSYAIPRPAAGTYTIVANSTDTGPVSSSAFTTTAAALSGGSRTDIGAHELVSANSAPDTLVWTTQPVSGTSTTTMVVRVTKSPAVGQATAINFQVKDSNGANVGAGVSGVDAGGGIWEMTLVYPAVGTGYTVVASGSGAVSATSSIFNVTAVTLTWTTQPTTGTTAQPITVRVTKSPAISGAVAVQLRNSSNTNVGTPLGLIDTGSGLWSATFNRPAFGTGYTLLASAPGAVDTASATFNANHQAAASGAVAFNDALAHGYNLAVAMVIGGTTYTVNAATELTATLNADGLGIHRSGPICTEVTFSKNVTSSLRLVFHLSQFLDGSNRTRIVFANDLAMLSTGGGGSDVQYSSITVTQGGATKFSRDTNLNQTQYTTFEMVVSSGASATQTVNVRHDVNYLQWVGAQPYEYDLTLAPLATDLTQWASNLPSLSNLPPSPQNGTTQNGLPTYMPTTGVAEQIGPINGSASAFLVSDDPTARAYMRGRAQGLGAYPLHFWDVTYNKYLSIDDRPTFWCDSRGNPTLTRFWDNSVWQYVVDSAHHPNLEVTEALVTGERYWLDQLNAQVSYLASNSTPGYRGDAGSADFHVYPGEQFRGGAWIMRNLEWAISLNRDGSVERNYALALANSSWAWMAAQIPALKAALPETYGVFPHFNGSDIGDLAHYQQGYFSPVVLQAVRRGNADARACMLFRSNYLLGLFERPDWYWQNGYGYGIKYGNGSLSSTAGMVANAYPTWAQIKTASIAAGSAFAYEPGYDWQGDYPQVGMVSVMTYCDANSFGGGTNTGEHAVALRAWRILGKIRDDNSKYLRMDQQFAFAVRMRDTTQLGWSEFLSSAVTSGTVSLAGTNALIYHKGGAVTLSASGNPGSSVLVNDTTNNCTLIGGVSHDWLLGGMGSDTMKPGAGYNIVRASTGACTVEANPATTGTIEIHGFKTGSDRIDIVGATPTPATALTSAVVAGGNTTLTIGSCNIILVGTVSGLTTANFI